eukprot:5034833-Amphidinium_carterae.2
MSATEGECRFRSEHSSRVRSDTGRRGRTGGHLPSREQKVAEGHGDETKAEEQRDEGADVAAAEKPIEEDVEMQSRGERRPAEDAEPAGVTKKIRTEVANVWHIEDTVTIHVPVEEEVRDVWLREMYEESTFYDADDGGALDIDQ